MRYRFSIQTCAFRLAAILTQIIYGMRSPPAMGDTPITRRAAFHGLCPWGNECSPEGRQAKLVNDECHGLCPWVSTVRCKINSEPLDFVYYIGYSVSMGQRTGRPRTGIKPNTSIRVDLNILHQARVAAVTQKKTLGQWLEEAIVEKIDREQKLNKGVQR